MCRKSGEIEVIYSADPDPEDLPKEIDKKNLSNEQGIERVFRNQ